jgi:hypothetical protein
VRVSRRTCGVFGSFRASEMIRNFGDKNIHGHDLRALPNKTDYTNRTLLFIVDIISSSPRPPKNVYRRHALSMRFYTLQIHVPV